MKKQSYRNRPLCLRVLLCIATVALLVTIGSCSYFTPDPNQSTQQDAGNPPQNECNTTADCIRDHGDAQNGCQWFCLQNKCKLTGSCNQDPSDAGTPDDTDDTPIDPGCLSDQLGVMQEGLCTCECKDCNCTGIDCNCDLTCYQEPPPPGCVVNVDENGNLVIDGNQLENCTVECEQESDLLPDMPCILNDCQVPANNVNIDINPNPQEVVDTAQMELEREIRNVDVLFVVDNSWSMEDDQMASYCAMDKFLDAASANGAQHQAGVINTDLANPTTGLQGIKNPNNCQLPMTDCQCKANGQLPQPPAGWQPCNFDQNGDWIEASDPSNADLLKQTIVQGEEHQCGCEGGLQQAFRLFARMELDGTFAGPYETVVISDEDANGDSDPVQHMCPFTSANTNFDQNLQNQLKNSPLGFNPPTPIGTKQSCKEDLAAFYKYYFQSRDIMVHGIIYDQACGGSSTEETGWIYEQVINATNGHKASICDCNAFAPFMEDVGNTTSDMSTQLCIENQNEAQKIENDLAAVILYYTENNADEIVPQSTTDGWKWDAATDCFLLSGSWEKKMGSFRVEYKGGPTQVIFEDVEVCLTNFDPIVSTIVVTCDVNGQDTVVPQSTTDGWSLETNNNQTCLVFTGSWREQTLSCSMEYRDNP